MISGDVPLTGLQSLVVQLEPACVSVTTDRHNLRFGASHAEGAARQVVISGDDLAAAFLEMRGYAPHEANEAIRGGCRGDQKDKVSANTDRSPVPRSIRRQMISIDNFAGEFPTRDGANRTTWLPCIVVGLTTDHHEPRFVILIDDDRSTYAMCVPEVRRVRAAK